MIYYYCVIIFIITVTIILAGMLSGMNNISSINSIPVTIDSEFSPISTPSISTLLVYYIKLYY